MSIEHNRTTIMQEYAFTDDAIHLTDNMWKLDDNETYSNEGGSTIKGGIVRVYDYNDAVLLQQGPKKVEIPKEVFQQNFGPEVDKPPTSQNDP
jgi:hypothetical protein